MCGHNKAVDGSAHLLVDVAQRRRDAHTFTDTECEALSESVLSYHRQAYMGLAIVLFCQQAFN